MSDGNGKVFTPQFIWQIVTWGFAQIIAGCMLYAAITNRMTTIEVKVATHDGAISGLQKDNKVDHDLSIRYEERLGFVKDAQAQEKTERVNSFDQLKAWIDTLKDRTSRLEGATGRR